MEEYTQADFDAFEVIDGIKQCPSGDYSDIQIFGKWCSFGRARSFGRHPRSGSSSAISVGLYYWITMYWRRISGWNKSKK